MAIDLNHTIVGSSDAQDAARWFAEMFGLAPPVPVGRFWQVTTGNGVGLDFATVDGRGEVVGQHYAFLVGDTEFDAIHGRIVERGLDHWADPGASRPGEINHNDGGRGVYFPSPDGHHLEILTRPYGSGA